jgi:sulfoxide reductase heme-binding subunit YedZ
MAAVLQTPDLVPTTLIPDGSHHQPWRRRRVWNGFTPFQLLVVSLATIAPLLIGGAIGAALLGLISTEAMMQFALAAGENPGMITFGAMFVASPIQWLTGRSQVRVRKYLGIVFFLLALSNGAMFALETGLAAALSAPFLIAGTAALALAVPLFLTSSRRSQRAMGMRRWRAVHKLTYLVAGALLAHVILLGDIGPGAVLITMGFVGRIPVVRRWLTRRAELRRA